MEFSSCKEKPITAYVVDKVLLRFSLLSDPSLNQYLKGNTDNNHE